MSAGRSDSIIRTLTSPKSRSLNSTELADSVEGGRRTRSVFLPPTVMSARFNGFAPVPRAGTEHPVTGGQPPFRM